MGFCSARGDLCVRRATLFWMLAIHPQRILFNASMKKGQLWCLGQPESIAATDITTQNSGAHWCREGDSTIWPEGAPLLDVSFRRRRHTPRNTIDSVTLPPSAAILVALKRRLLNGPHPRCFRIVYGAGVFTSTCCTGLTITAPSPRSPRRAEVPAQAQVHRLHRHPQQRAAPAIGRKLLAVPAAHGVGVVGEPALPVPVARPFRPILRRPLGRLPVHRPPPPHGSGLVFLRR